MVSSFCTCLASLFPRGYLASRPVKQMRKPFTWDHTARIARTSSRRSLLHVLNAGRQLRALHVPLVTVTSSSRAAMASGKEESDKLECGSD